MCFIQVMETYIIWNALRTSQVIKFAPNQHLTGPKYGQKREEPSEDQSGLGKYDNEGISYVNGSSLLGETGSEVKMNSSHH